MKLYCPITIDLYKVYPLQVMEAQQGNVGRGAIVTLTAGSAVIDPTDETVEVYAKKPDGTVSWLECSVEDAKVKINFTNQMLMSPGILQVELRMKDDEDDITTPIFKVKVNKSNVQSAGRSENELPLLDQIKKNAEDAKRAAEAAETAVGNKVTNPAIGAVGQILEIETVDDEGKPLTYKAVEKPESGVDKELSQIIHASKYGVVSDGFSDTVIVIGKDAAAGDVIKYVIEENSGDITVIYDNNDTGEFNITTIDHAGEAAGEKTLTAEKYCTYTFPSEMDVYLPFNIPAKTSQLTDDVGFAKQDEISKLSEEIGDFKSQITKRSENLFDWRNAILFDGYNNGSELVSSSLMKCVIFPVKLAHTEFFTISRFVNKGARFSVGTLKDEPADGVTVYGTVQKNDATSLHRMVTSDTKYIVVWFYNSQYDNLAYTDYLKYMTITNGLLTPSSYIPHQMIDVKEDNLSGEISVKNRVVSYRRTLNLFDYKNPMIINAYNNTETLVYGEAHVSILIPVSNSSNVYYTVSRFGRFGRRFSVGLLKDEPADGVTVYGTVQKDDAESLRIVATTDAKYLLIWFYNSQIDVENYEYYMRYIQVTQRYLPPLSYSEYYAENHVLSNKKINFLGDSFTDDSTSYEYHLVDRTGCTNVHLGKGNSAIVTDVDNADSFLTRMSGLDENADITIIFGGINDARDIHNNSIVLGNIDSTHDVSSFYGGMQLLLDNIIAKVPHQFLIGVIPPSFQPNAPYKTHLPFIQQAEREIYEKYHIPYVDLEKNCFAMSENIKLMELYRKSIVEPTNYHPNKEGASKIADCVQGELERYIH